MKQAVLHKDFETVAELTMKDSNNFHAVCRDTFPTINYLNETSEFIIKCVENINNIFIDDEKIDKHLKKTYLRKFIVIKKNNNFFFLNSKKLIILVCLFIRCWTKCFYILFGY